MHRSNTVSNDLVFRASGVLIFPHYFLTIEQHPPPYDLALARGELLLSAVAMLRLPAFLALAAGALASKLEFGVFDGEDPGKRRRKKLQCRHLR